MGKFNRYDGTALKKVDPIFKLMPHIIPKRYDSTIMFDTELDIGELEKFVSLTRKSGEIKGLRTVHVVAAAMVRTLSQRPHSNRFIIGRRIYARKGIRMSLVIKREMTQSAPEDTITPKFDYKATLKDVVDTIDGCIAKSASNETDSTAAALTKCPNFLLLPIVGLLKLLDHFGVCPKAILDASPFHSSFFMTDVGSLGINPVYHHIFDFGNTTIFLAMGKKGVTNVLNSDGTVKRKRTLGIRFVMDERVCDGFYNAGSIKLFEKLMSKPQLLMIPPENVYADEWL